MGPVAWAWVAVLAVASLLLAHQMARRPVLVRMAVRHARRNGRRTVTVVAGLMVATAIITSALVGGDSAGSAVEDAVYRSLGHVDQTLAIDGFPFFPDASVAAFEADAAAHPFFDGVAGAAVWSMASQDGAGQRFEPRTVLMGYDGEAMAGFRPFHLEGGGTFDGRGLPRDGAVVSADLARALDVREGDAFRVSFTRPVDPFLPDVHAFQGTVSGAGTGLPLLPGIDVQSVERTVQVPQGATRIVTAVAGAPPSLPGVDAPHALRVELESPSGVVHAARGPAGTMESPLWLNVSAPVPAVLEEGMWRLRVDGEGAIGVQVQGAAVVLKPVYDLEELARRGHVEDLEGLEDLLPLRPREHHAMFTVHAVTDGGRGDQFELPNAAFVRLDTLQRLLDREHEVNLVLLSNPGGIVEGTVHTEEALVRIEAVLEGIRQQYDHPALHALSVSVTKKEFLDLAEDTSRVFTGFLLFGGGLTILAGVLLIVNIFTMLAEERRTELGVARAVGMSRADMVRLFLFEGALYAVAAAAVGAFVGVLLAWAMVSGLNAFLPQEGPGAFPPIPFRVLPGAVASAFAAGAMLTYVTAGLASARAGRLNVVRAIRKIPEPEHVPGRRAAVAGALLAAAGVAAGAAGWWAWSLTLQVLGPLAAALGLRVLLCRRWRRRRVDPALAALLAAYYILSYFLSGRAPDSTEANIIGPLRGALLALCVVVLVVYFDAGPRVLARGLARLRPLRAVALPALSYPRHRRFRTGMTLAMFAVVLLSIGFFSVFGALFQVDPARQTGGFHVEAVTTLDVEDLGPYDRGLVPDGTVEAVHRLSVHRSVNPGFITVEGERTGHFGAPRHFVYGGDAAFYADQEFPLLWRHDDYADDAAAYRALMERDDVVIAAYTYSTDERGRDLAHSVGDALEMHFGDTVRSFTIIGIQEQYHFPGVFLRQEQVEALFPRTEGLWLYRLADGVDAVEAAHLLQSNYRDAGMQAEASQERVLEDQRVFRQIMGAMKLFLGLGLVVGVLSLGIVTARSVLERRQEIGMLRALGFRPGQVRALFLTEATLLVLTGAAVGLACSIVVTYGIWFALLRGLPYPYTVPWLEILGLVAVAYAVAMLATLAPIRRAARTPPADAVRYIE